MLDRPVTYYLRSPVFSVAADTELSTVRQRLESHNVSCLGVSEGADPLAGVVSRTDLLRIARFERSAEGASHMVLPTQKVRELMHRPVYCIEPNETLRAAARAMVTHSVHRVFVRKAKTVFGVVGTQEVMRALVDARVNTHMSELMSAPVGTMDATTPLSEAVQRLRSTGVTGLVVVTAEGTPIGLFTQREALEATGHADDVPVDVVMSARFIGVQPNSSVHHAAAQAAATRARHILVMDGRQLKGIVAGLDFARAAG
ncbi:MAG: CBS domain-containing protein [Polyangiaceae bacterium]